MIKVTSHQYTKICSVNTNMHTVFIHYTKNDIVCENGKSNDWLYMKDMNHATHFSLYKLMHYDRYY